MIYLGRPGRKCDSSRVGVSPPRLCLSPPRLCAALFAICALTACAYPRRSTSLSPVGADASSRVRSPDHMVHLRVLRAQIPPQQRSGLPWDEDGSAPDPLVRIYRDGKLIFESEVEQDTLRPEFTATLERNLWMPPDARFRLEVWDRDRGLSDPIGIYRFRGFLEDLAGGNDASLFLDGGAILTIRGEPPRAHRGTGISLYEVRRSGLHIVELERHSPSFRAGIRVGDVIVAIEGRSIQELGEAGSVSALSLAAAREVSIAVRRGGRHLDLTLDGGYTWLAM